MLDADLEVLELVRVWVCVTRLCQARRSGLGLPASVPLFASMISGRRQA